MAFLFLFLFIKLFINEKTFHSLTTELHIVTIYNYNIYNP